MDGALSLDKILSDKAPGSFPRAYPTPLHVGFLATGTFQREVGDISSISQPSISRTMPAVLDAIISLDYIQFPYSDPEI